MEGDTGLYVYCVFERLSQYMIFRFVPPMDTVAGERKRSMQKVEGEIDVAAIALFLPTSSAPDRFKWRRFM